MLVPVPGRHIGNVVQIQTRRWAAKVNPAPTPKARLTRVIPTPTSEAEPAKVKKTRVPKAESAKVKKTPAPKAESTKVEKTIAPKAESAKVKRKPAPKAESADKLTAKTPLARKLLALDVWTLGRGNSKKKLLLDGSRVSVDAKRVNITSKELCDDVIKYLGSSLDRHKGCDIIDVNPGTGLWSKALNDVLKPRTHVLCEPDEDLYRPFLGDLLRRPGVQLVGQSAIEWKALDMLLAKLPHQRPRERGEPQERNDTLLMTGNISWYPNKPWPGFDNVADLILFQLFNSIRLQTLFQRYGLVRMLIWMRDDHQAPILPRSVKHRSRVSIDGELMCDWIRSVAEVDWAAQGNMVEQLKHKRDEWLDQQSAMLTIQRMRDAGITVPEHRKSTALRHIEKALELDPELKQSESPAAIQHSASELEALKDELAREGRLEPEKQTRYNYLVRHCLRRERDAHQFGELLDEWLAIPQRADEETAEGSKRRDAAWNAKIEMLHSRKPIDFRNVLCNYNFFHQDPPVLHWDRRTYEPLAIRPDEFFPNVECCLVDIQPKALHPLMQENGEGTSRAGDMLKLIMAAAHRAPSDPVSRTFNAIYPGAGRMALRECKSFTDPKLGGMCGTGQNELWSRALSAKQWLDFLEAYMKWPFRLPYPDLVARLADVDTTRALDTAPPMGAQVPGPSV